MMKLLQFKPEFGISDLKTDSFKPMVYLLIVTDTQNDTEFFTEYLCLFSVKICGYRLRQ